VSFGSESEALFEAIGTLAHAVRDHVATGQLREMGQALNRNQQLLRELGVSSPPLERLIGAAQEAGALGAKLSGGGGGGIMLALVDEKRAAAVAQALQVAGATCIFHTVVG
jgi:mevalonate kinase